MAKSKVNKNSISSAFKLALLLTLVLGTIWFIYNYLQTGSFIFKPSAKGDECTTSSQCGKGYLCKAGVCIKNAADSNCCTTKQLKAGYECKKIKNKYSCDLTTKPKPVPNCSIVGCPIQQITYSKSEGGPFCKPNTNLSCDVIVDTVICNKPSTSLKDPSERNCGICSGWIGSDQGMNKIPIDKCIAKEIKMTYVNCAPNEVACPN